MEQKTQTPGAGVPATVPAQGQPPADVIDGEIISLSGGLVAVRENVVVNVPGLTNDDDDIGPPWIKVDQNTGEFVISGERVKDIYAVILAKRDGRARFEKDENGNPILSRPICRSRDFVKGVGTPGGNCVRCQLKEWPEKKGGKPDCSTTIEFMLAIDFFGAPTAAFLSVKGDSIKPARNYWRNLQLRFGRNEWRALTHITLETRKYQGAKVYYVPCFEQVQGEDFLTNEPAIAVLSKLKAQLEASFGRSAVEADADETDPRDAEAMDALAADASF